MTDTRTEEKTTNRIRFVAIGIVSMFALTALAQQPTAPANASPQDGAPTVATQLKILTEKLDLTSDQQVKIKPILDEMHDAMAKLVADKSLSREERLEKVKPLHYDADRKLRAILSDDQKKKLDAYEHGPHPEMHGNLGATTH